MRANVAYQPDKYLASFETLPQAGREAIVEAILDCSRWGVRGFEGRWYAYVLRLLWLIKGAIYRLPGAESRAIQFAREAVDVVAFSARRAPVHAIYTLHRQWLAAKGRFSSRPKIAEMLSLAGIEPRDLAICYAREIPQLHRYRGYWHDPSRQSTVGRVLGIDLQPADDGYWFIESNGDPGLEYGRSGLYEGDDPMVRNLFAFANSHGYRHVMVVINTSTGVDPTMARRYTEEAAARRIRLTLLELPSVSGRDLTRSYGLPRLDEGTLVARIRFYPTALDHLFESKRASYRALGLYQRETNDPDLLLPKTGPDPVLGDVTPDDPFPNVVYKLPELEQGIGVYFLKAETPEHARSMVSDGLGTPPHKRGLQTRLRHAFTDRQGLYQAYKKSRMVGNRQLYKIRAMVLLTPVGIQFLSAHRIVGRRSVPERLDPGVVVDPAPYLVNFASGGRHALMGEDEEDAVKRATLAVARGLGWAAEYGFRSS